MNKELSPLEQKQKLEHKLDSAIAVVNNLHNPGWINTRAPRATGLVIDHPKLSVNNANKIRPISGIWDIKERLETVVIPDYMERIIQIEEQMKPEVETPQVMINAEQALVSTYLVFRHLMSGGHSLDTFTGLAEVRGALGLLQESVVSTARRRLDRKLDTGEYVQVRARGLNMLRQIILSGEQREQIVAQLPDSNVRQALESLFIGLANPADEQLLLDTINLLSSKTQRGVRKSEQAGYNAWREAAIGKIVALPDLPVTATEEVYVAVPQYVPYQRPLATIEDNPAEEEERSNIIPTITRDLMRTPEEVKKIIRRIFDRVEKLLGKGTEVTEANLRREFRVYDTGFDPLVDNRLVYPSNAVKGPHRFDRLEATLAVVFFRSENLNPRALSELRKWAKEEEDTRKAQNASGK